MPDLRGHYDRQLLDERERLAQAGSFRDKVRCNLVDRPHYACGLLAAADMARFCGISRICALEFGVASGGGLLNLCELAPLVTKETGVAIEVIGFDTGSGLPPLESYRDHPEIWQEGDFCMADRKQLLAKLPAHGRIIFGDIAETIAPFLAAVQPAAPIGFVSVDVDIYRSSKDALNVFLGAAETLLPVVVTYFDDTLGSPARMGSLFRNRFAGQLLAIDEFNQEQEYRKIDVLRILKYRQPFDKEQWLDQMYAVHVHDHPFRNRLSQPGRNADKQAARSRMLWE